MKQEKKKRIIKITLCCTAVLVFAGMGLYFGIIHYLHQSMNYVGIENEVSEQLNVSDAEEKDWKK